MRELCRLLTTPVAYFEEISCSLALAFLREYKTLIMLAMLASFLNFFKYAFKDIISRASSSDVSVHFCHKSSCTISNPLDALDKFYEMTFYFVDFLFASLFPSCILFCYCIVTFVDCAHLHNFAQEKDT